MDWLYAGSSLVAVARLAVWALVVFVLIPRLLFRGVAEDSDSSLVSGVLQMLFAGIVVVNVLLVLRVFDQYSLVASFAAIYLARAWLVRHLSLRSVALLGWRRLVVVSLDAVEAAGDARRFTAARWRAARSWVVASRPRGAGLAFAFAVVALVGAYSAFLLADVVGHPSSDLPDYLDSLTHLKALAVGRPVAQTSAVLYLVEILRRASNVDAALLLRVAPALMAVGLLVTVLWSARRLGSGRGGTLLAGLLFVVLGVTGLLPVAQAEGPTPLAVAAGLLAMVPALVLALERSAGRGKRDRTLLVAQGAFVAAFLWPAGGLLLLVLVVAGAVAVVAVPSHRARPAPAGATVGAAAAGSLAGWCLAALLEGWADVEGVAGHLWLVSGDASLGAPGRTATLATAWAVVAAAVVLWPYGADRWAAGRRGIGLGLLAVAVWTSPTSFGLPSLLPVVAVLQVAAVVGCLAAALLFALIRSSATAWWRSRGGLVEAGWFRALAPSGALEVGTCLVVATLVLVGLGPVQVVRGQRVQSDAVVSALYRIAADLPPYQWTLVSDPTEQPQVSGLGQFMDTAYFLTTYDPVTWRFDPRAPELAVPTPYLVVLLRSDAPRDQAQQIRLWFATFASLHKDQPLNISQPSPDLTVYQVHRPPELDEQVLDEIRQGRAPFSATPRQPAQYSSGPGPGAGAGTGAASVAGGDVP